MAEHRRELVRPTRTNQVWSLDFITGELIDGRRFRVLTIVDVFTRESLGVEVGASLKGTHVVEVSIGSVRSVGFLGYSLGGNGSEFSSQIMNLRAYQNGVWIAFSRPGKPTDNAYIESFNGTFRTACLDIHWLTTLAETKQVIEAWRRQYNGSRPDRLRRSRKTRSGSVTKILGS